MSARIVHALLVALVAGIFWSPCGASAQRMDLSLARLRTDAGGTYVGDDAAWRQLATQFAGSLIPATLMPAHTRGMRGIHVDVQTSLTGIDSGQGYWRRGTEGDLPAASENRFVDSVLAWNRLNARKGLPFGFEIGTNVGFLLNTSYWSMGVDVRWSLLEGLRDPGSSVYFPSLSVRGSVQTLLGDGELHVTVPSIDVSLGERFVVGDSLEISPYVGAQVAWVFADSELVDLTPERDAFADPSDLDNNVVFPSVRSTRARMFVGSQFRYEWFALTGAFSFDLLEPSQLDGALPATPRQWRVDLGAGVSY